MSVGKAKEGGYRGGASAINRDKRVEMVVESRKERRARGRRTKRGGLEMNGLSLLVENVTFSLKLTDADLTDLRAVCEESSSVARPNKERKG